MMYLDYNATAPLRSEVVARMQELHAQPLNPSSVHAAGREAKAILEASRRTIAEAVACFSNEVVFTASGTESNAMVLNQFRQHPLFVAATEHTSLLKPAEQMGASILPVTNNGTLDLNALAKQLQNLGETSRKPLVSVMLANNETGVIQPIAEIARIVHEHKGVLHTDASQALGKIPVDMGMMGADLMTLCAHKMGGPLGAGALVARQDITVLPLMIGGGQELGRRAGTENVAAIAGFATACEVAQSDTWQTNAERWMRELEAQCKAASPEVVIMGEAVDRLPNTSSILMPGVKAETQLMTFDLAGFAVSAGSACSSGRIAVSHVLKAMGYNGMEASSAIRVSAGWGTTEDEIKSFANQWLSTYEKLQKKAA